MELLSATRFLWKPLLRRAITGGWRRFPMLPGIPAQPAELKHPGLYLHVPFCKNLCPFCPYNRIEYDENRYRAYERAVHQEIDRCAPSFERYDIASLYIGGGTPTVDVPGLARLITHLRDVSRSIGDVCVELHPASMDDGGLAALREIGVTMVSIGVESTNDTLLARIGRSHDGAVARDSLARAMRAGFSSVNADLMFALPGQGVAEWGEDVRRVLDCGVDQVSTYPLFSFPYSEDGARIGITSVMRPPERRILSMLASTVRLCRERGLERCAVWSWLKPDRKKFSSITRHHYIGFGPSAATMTGAAFHVNTFDVDAYAAELPDRRPVALTLPVSRRLEMAYWLYWRVYELDIRERDFKEIFGDDASLADVFGAAIVPFRAMGMIRKTAGGYAITERGAYWIHRLQNEYSLNYINRLWGTCRRSAWPESVVL